MSRRLTLAVLSAALYILAFPNFNLSCIAWVALVPLSLAIHRSEPKEAFWLGWLTGTLAYGGILYWIVVTFLAAHLSLMLALAALLALSAYLGLFWGAWAIMVQKIPNPLFGAAAWVGLEYLRTYLFSGFPWALLADSQVRNLPLIQIASVTGVYGVSFLMVWINLAVAGGKCKSWAGAMAAILFTCLYGAHRLRAPSFAPKSKEIRVALLQGSIDQYKKWDQAYVADIEKTYENLVMEAAQSKPDIILWPETSIPGNFMRDAALDSWLQPLIKRSRTHHLVGAPIMDSKIAYNAAFSIDPKGHLDGIYAKHHLVPFGEVVPWASVLGRFINVLNDLGGFTAGEQSPVLEVGGHQVGVNICYEAIFPNLVRQSVRRGAEVIANLTNDGWYMKTAAPSQHWAPNIFRAVENDRWLIRADNTGFTGIIDPGGRVITRSALFQPCVIEGKIQTRTTSTAYTRCGDLFAQLCLIITAIGVFVVALG